MPFKVNVKAKGQKETVINRRRKNTALIKGADIFLEQAEQVENPTDVLKYVGASRTILSGEFEAKANGLSVKIVEVPRPGEAPASE